jgi:hypothetical protein
MSNIRCLPKPQEIIMRCLSPTNSSGSGKAIAHGSGRVWTEVFGRRQAEGLLALQAR